MNEFEKDYIFLRREKITSFLECLFLIVTVPLIVIFIYIKDKLNKRLYIFLLPNGVKEIYHKN